MKNRLIKNIAFAALLSTLSLASCKKTILTAPYSVFTTANFFSDEGEATMAVLGVYDIMATSNLYGYHYFLYDLDNDITVCDQGGQTDFRAIPHYAITAENGMFYSSWSQLYKGIDRANIVIETIPKMALYSAGTDEQKSNLNRLIAEAKFLRGFYYSELIKLWGDVPFKLTSSVTGEDFNSERIDRYIIYQQIIKDIAAAAEMLPATLPTDERINKWAAKAMLARIALFAGGYSLRQNGTMERPADYLEYYKIAQQQINDVIGCNLYKLNADFGQVFRNQCKLVKEPTENMFEIAFYSQTNANAGLGNFVSVTTTNGVYGSTLSRVKATATFYNNFSAGDLRRDFTIAQYTINTQGDRIPVTGRVDENWTTGKWSREFQVQVSTERGNTSINTVILRYSDVLLMRAEVENELNNGPNQLALDAINEVRRRAFGLLSSGGRVKVTVTAPGSGYSTPPALKITGGERNEAVAQSAALVNGTVATVNMLNEGTNYTVAPIVDIAAPWAAGFVNWQPNKAYALNTKVFTGTHYYNVATAGTTTAIAPDHTNGNSTAAQTGAVFTYASPATAVSSILPKPTSAEVDFVATDKADFFNKVVNERACELAFEGGRRADLIRWNLLAGKIAETRANLRPSIVYLAADNFQKNKHELYPIPLNEKEVNKLISQNPGY